jgi:two-component system sensor histidine kinase RegB
MALHLQGMWVAMAVTAGLIVYFVSMLQRELSNRERELASMRANQQTMTSLTAMAAGAAHELATPLSTIAVTSKELELELERADDPDLAEDAKIIRSQVERCRAVLDRMASDAGQGRGESTRPTRPESALHDARKRLSEPDRILVDLEGELPDLQLPRESFSEVLTSLLQNALDASDARDRVTASIRPLGDGVEFEISDTGTGMASDELARATEPFFTTKHSRDRMGLGLYVARQLAVDLDGELQLDSEPGEGTRVRLWIPSRPPTIRRSDTSTDQETTS